MSFKLTEDRASTIRRNFVRYTMFSAVVLCSFLVTQESADATGYRNYGRQYYSSWSYHPTTRYYYCRYNYQPTVTVNTYHHHYVIYYPSRPRYRYYYNPVRRTYWGRYEVDANGNAVGYSMLAKEDRKSTLDEIPESAFPKASKNAPHPGVR